MSAPPSATPRALLLTGRPFWPIDDGWKIRTSCMHAALGAAGVQVECLSFSPPRGRGDQTGGPPDTEVVPRSRHYAPSALWRGLVGPTPFSVHNYTEPAFARALEHRREQRYDLLLVEDVVMAQYATRVNATVRWLDMHNIESELMLEYARGERSVPRRLYAHRTARLLRKYESRIATTFDDVLVCSPADRERLHALAPSASVRVVPNAIDTTQVPVPVPVPTRRDVIAFVGSMDYHANEAGVLWFCQEVMPLLRTRVPGITFRVIGKHPSAAVRACATADIEVLGRVESVGAALTDVAAVVAPLLVGGGTRLKILEAMTLGRPVISTLKGAEGLSVVHGRDVMLGESATDLADAVAAVLSDAALWTRLVEHGRALVDADYSWQAIGRLMQRLLGERLPTVGIPSPFAPTGRPEVCS